VEYRSSGYDDYLELLSMHAEYYGPPPLIGSYGGQDLQSISYDERRRLIAFERQLPTGELQSFEGFVFDRPVTVDLGNLSTTETKTWGRGMAGTFTGLPLEEASRPLYGWFAVYLYPALKLNA
jgi:hypothetical protein